MNQKSPWLGLLITVGVFLLIYLCYYLFFNQADAVIIDNPTNAKITLSIDGKEYTIGKEQSVELNLEKGEHHIQYNYKGFNVDTVFEMKYHRGVINPTRNDYYIFKRPYGVKKNRDSIFLSKTTEIDDKIYHGEIKKNNNLWIDQFSIGLEKDYPKIIKKPNKDSLTGISKIFRKQEFKQFYFENYE